MKPASDLAVSSPNEDHLVLALQVYEEITGFHETNKNALWHHRLSVYGPPCLHCGKPLRTTRAKHCAACGRDVKR